MNCDKIKDEEVTFDKVQRQIICNRHEIDFGEERQAGILSQIFRR